MCVSLFVFLSVALLRFRLLFNSVSCILTLIVSPFSNLNSERFHTLVFLDGDVDLKNIYVPSSRYLYSQAYFTWSTDSDTSGAGHPRCSPEELSLLLLCLLGMQRLQMKQKVRVRRQSEGSKQCTSAWGTATCWQYVYERSAMLCLYCSVKKSQEPWQWAPVSGSRCSNYVSFYPRKLHFTIKDSDM